MPTIVRREAPRAPTFPRKLVVAWGNAMLNCLDRSEAELSVLLTDDAAIRVLNRDYRQKDRPTDVLSFHFEGGASSASIEADWLLGDVVISLDTAARQAKGRKRPLSDEVRWLLAHGVLHLCGYDHASPGEKRTMVNLTRRLVRAAQSVTPTANGVPVRAASSRTIGATPSKAKPSRAKPSRAKPSKAKPSKAKPSKAKPSKAKPSKAKPSRAKPSKAKPSKAKPSKAR